MRYKKLTVTHCDIRVWGVANIDKGIILVNETYRPDFKLKLARKDK